MTAQTTITAAELRVGDRLVWPGESKYNVAADAIEPVLDVDQTLRGSVVVVTRHHFTNRTWLLLPEEPVRVLTPRLTDEDTP